MTFKPTTKGSHKADLVVTGTFGSKTIKLSGSARERTPAELAVRVFGPRRAAPGSTVTLKAKIYNRGEIAAKGVTLKTVVPKSLAAKIKPIRIKSIAAGKPVTKKIRIRVKPAPQTGNRIKVRFTVSAKSAKTGKFVPIHPNPMKGNMRTALIAATVLVGMCFASTAQAADFTVTSTADSNDPGTLRAAMNDVVGFG